MPATKESIRAALEAVARENPGPGGAVAILQNGELVDQLVWGYADLDQRIAMTSDTLMPICSITKQFLCMLLIDLERNPPASFPEGKGSMREQLSDALRQVLGSEVSDSTGLQVNHLCNNQSGIRDYYAMSVLQGARPGGEFSLVDKALERIVSFMFDSGSQFSYSNTNFHILARLIEKITGISLGELLSDRLFASAEMTTAALCPNTATHPGPCVGYEGTREMGFFRACNRMEWSGDAGIVASLSDMIAYEQYVDRSWSDPGSLYRAIAEPQVFNDGNKALYGYGLFHGKVQDKEDWVEYTGHGGALPGFRLRRLYAPSERMSVILMFNHEADVEALSETTLRRALDLGERHPRTFIAPDISWAGDYLDPVSQLVIAITLGSSGNNIVLNYAGGPENLHLTCVDQAESPDTIARKEGEYLIVHRLQDNNTIHARRLTPGRPPSDFAGKYRCDEAGSTFCCTGQGDLLYGAFSGYLGNGPAHLMRYLGGDVWALACPRGLDAPAPGNWTVVFHRSDNDCAQIVGVTLGCWLARSIPFTKL